MKYSLLLTHVFRLYSTENDQDPPDRFYSYLFFVVQRIRIPQEALELLNTRMYYERFSWAATTRLLYTDLFHRTVELEASSTHTISFAGILPSFLPSFRFSSESLLLDSPEMVHL